MKNKYVRQLKPTVGYNLAQNFVEIEAKQEIFFIYTYMQRNRC